MGSQDLVRSLTSFLPVSAWFWGCWLWPTLVIAESQKIAPPREVHGSGVSLALALGLCDWGGSKRLLNSILEFPSSHGAWQGVGAREPGTRHTSWQQGRVESLS